VRTEDPPRLDEELDEELDHGLEAAPDDASHTAPVTRRERRRAHDRRTSIRVYELMVTVPVVAYLVWSVFHDPQPFSEWQLYVWTIAVAVAELLPVPTNVSMRFSLSFPLELSAAMLFPTPAAAAIAFVGSADPREFRGEVPPLKALFVRAQISVCVIAESLIFTHLVHPDYSAAFNEILKDVNAWTLLIPTLLAAIVGYSLNTLFVAGYSHFQTGKRVLAIVREMHRGVFGEFLASYMALALFAVLVATSVQSLGVFAILVFAAPLAFARQMFQRTHSLQEATSELAEKQAENEYQALHDSLTGMPNRMLFQQRLVEAIAEGRRKGERIAVMLIDLDHFKEINDTLGHHFGDLLLQEIGPRLSSVLRDNDLMARLGGDEFGIVLPELPSEDAAMRIADRLLEELETPVSVEGLALDVSGSIGIALFPTQAQDAEALLRRADVAMYAAKENGGGYELYADDMDRHNPARLTLIGQVRPALESGEFVLYYQPKVRLSDGRAAGAEALIRWDHPSLGLLSPDEFVPLVEKTVLLRPLTHHVIETVLKQWREWADMGIRIPIAINVSARSLLDQELPEQVEAQLRRWDVPPAFLRMELTESFLMGDSGRSSQVLDALSDVGVGLSIDDFGTGYSSLSYLKRLPIEEIKIDRSFVMQMHVDANDFMIVRATVDLGRNLGLRVVAEGVEDLATFDRLAEFECDEAQGYYISRPLSAIEFTRWLSVRNLELESARTDDRDGDRSDDRDDPGRERLRVV
jgi:diguanylate cyclase (GGDEF)-like protein